LWPDAIRGLADEKAEQKLIEEEGEEFLRKYKEKRQQ
jgi:hypothetical protein